MDVVCNRAVSARILDDSPSSHEQAGEDRQWQKFIELELIPHPHQENPEAIELDYEMKDGKKSHRSPSCTCRLSIAQMGSRLQQRKALAQMCRLPTGIGQPAGALSSQ